MVHIFQSLSSIIFCVSIIYILLCFIFILNGFNFYLFGFRSSFSHLFMFFFLAWIYFYFWSAWFHSVKVTFLFLIFLSKSHLSFCNFFKSNYFNCWKKHDFNSFKAWAFRFRSFYRCIKLNSMIWFKSDVNLTEIKNSCYQKTLKP